MTSFYYYDQNPSGFCFLVQIRAFVIQTSLGLQNLNKKDCDDAIVQITGKSSYFSIQKLLWLRLGFLIIHKAKNPDEVVQWIFYGYLVITFEIQKISIYGQPYPMLYMEIKITTCEF